jgi:hypothetical protein
MSLTRRKPLKRQSKKRAKESKVYMDKRKAFLAANRWCQWHLSELLLSKGKNYTTATAPIDWSKVPRSTEVHHKKGRSGPHFLDESTWMAVSTKAHRYIHAHGQESREKGYIL